MPTINDDFPEFLLDVSNISRKMQFYHYTRGLKGSIWEKLSRKDYKELSEAMKDAWIIEEAHCRVGTCKGTQIFGP